MIRFTLILFSLIFISACSERDDKTDSIAKKIDYDQAISIQENMIDLNLEQGYIKLEYEFGTRGDKIKSKGKLLSIKQYDNRNNLIQEDNMHFRFDSLNRCVMELKYYVTGRADTTLFAYNEKDQMVEKRFIRAADYKTRTTYSYNSAGKKTKQTRYENGIKSLDLTYKYDNNNNLVSKHFGDYQDDYGLKSSYEHFKDGYLETNYKSDGSLYHTIRFKFDSLGNEIEQIIYDENGDTQSENYNIFDNKNRLIKYYNVFRGDTGLVKTWEYDNKGNLQEHLNTSVYSITKYFYNQVDSLVRTETYDNETRKLKFVKLIIFKNN